MSSSEDIQADEPNTSIDPYDILNLSNEATEAEIRSAYKKLALKHHPDKVGPEGRDAAHKQFQNIAFAYAILSDPKRRKRYDTTGSTAESALDDDDFDWSDFFRARYTEVTQVQLEEFEQKYKDSDEEKADLLKAYEKFQGRMNKVYEEVMLSNPMHDEDRFQRIILQAIENGEVDEHDAFVNEPAKSRKRRIDKAKREAQEAEEYAEELEAKKKAGKKGRKTEVDELEVDGSASSDEDDEEDEQPRKSKARAKAASKPSSKKSSKPKPGGGMGDLAAMISQRQQSRASTFLDDLEARYAPKSGKAKRRTPMEEPSEEAFEAMAARKSSKKARK